MKIIRIRVQIDARALFLKMVPSGTDDDNLVGNIPTATASWPACPTTPSAAGTRRRATPAAPDQ